MNRPIRKRLSREKLQQIPTPTCDVDDFCVPGYQGAMTYDEIDPPKDLQTFVWQFWEFSVPAGSKTPEHSIVPDGAINIVCCKNPHFTLVRIKGPTITATPVPLIPGSMYWGIRFMPYTGAALLGVSSADLFGQVLDLKEINPRLENEIVKLACRSSTGHEMTGGLWDLLREFSPPANLDADVIVAVRLLMESRGNIRMDQVAAGLKVGLRHLQRKFKSLTGLTLKEFATVQRMRSHLVANLAFERRGTPPVDLGYVDQSHAIHESRKVMDKTPPQILAELAEIEYGKFS